MAIEAAFFGTLGRDAELKTSKNGKTYLRLNMRVGEDDAAQWVSVMCFDRDAIEVADKLVKGARVYTDGKLSLNEWHNADGVVKAGLNVLSWHCRLAQIGRHKVRRDGDTPTENVSVAAGKSYHSPRSAPAGRLPNAEVSHGGGKPFHDDPIPFSPEWR